MKLLGLYVYYLTLDFLRQPSYVVTTMIFPAMFFWFFAVPNATSVPAANMLMAGFSAYAVLGVVLFQLSITVASERASNWSRYLRTLPVNSSTVIGARLFSSLILSGFAVLGVVAVAQIFTNPSLDRGQWIEFFMAAFLGGIPFAAMGVFVGLVTTPKSALPTANLIYLPLSFAGGLWMPPNILPKVVQDISPYLPTRFFGEWMWAIVGATEVANKYLAGLLIYFIVFMILSVYFYRMDQKKRFSC